MTAQTAPPEAAVASDPHWAARMQRLRDRKPVERELHVYDDDSPRRDVEMARLAVTAARAEASDAEAPERAEQRRRLRKLESELEAAEADLAQHRVTLRFRALPRDVYEALQAAHPPTKEQEANGEAYNVDTFAPALIAATSVDGMTEAEATELLTSWNQAEAGALFGTAVAVNTVTRVSLGNASGPTLG